MARLPLIACFHGGGSNAAVMSLQCARLQKMFQHTFEFVYFEAPFIRSAGPGVLPGFKDYGPFKTWFKIDEEGNEKSDGSGYDYHDNDGIERVLKLMLAEGEAQEWVGVLGFSQGTRVVGGLLREQQKRIEAGEKCEIILKFGVLCMGGAGPMLSKSFHDSLFERYGVVASNEVSHMEERIAIPTLHLHGLKDINLNNGRKQLATFYEADSTRLLEINYHHAMPWEQSDIAEFAKMIMELYQDTR
ncbi:hypothetical protein P7C71_g1153, partial [Lecanoromycetidae sp. Uapishka_2]